MDLIYTALTGLVIGLLAKWIMPGRDPGDGKGCLGLAITAGIGIAGSFVGGLLAGLIGLGGGGLLWKILFGVVGALLLLFLYRRLFREK